MSEIERLTRSNSKLQEQVKQQNRRIMVLQNECEMHKEIVKKWMKQRQFLQQQIKELRRKDEQNKYSRQESQSRYLNVLRKMQDELDDRKQKYQRLENKIQPLVDHDSVRLKILNEVQSVHFSELQEQKRKSNNFKDEILRLKRENEVLKHELESCRMDYKDQIRRIRNEIEMNGRNAHLNELTYEMCNQIENRLRLNYEQARKESDYYKDKYFTCQKKYQERISLLEKEMLEAKKQVLTV